MSQETSMVCGLLGGEEALVWSSNEQNRVRGTASLKANEKSYAESRNQESCTSASQGTALASGQRWLSQVVLEPIRGTYPPAGVSLFAIHCVGGSNCDRRGEVA